MPRRSPAQSTEGDAGPEERGPLVGRREELAFVEGLLRNPGAGGLVIAGAAGVGKTRLAAEAAREATASGFATAWAVGTHAAATIPLGALAHLLPPSDDMRTPSFELVRRAGEALAARGGGGRVLLVVDDAHLLDAASAALVHQLGATRRAFLVVTVRTGEEPPDPIVGLWKDGLAEYLELQTLSRGEVEQLVEETLGGDVDGATLMRIWEATRGNALYLRELVLDGLESGRLAASDGVWRWEGALAPGTRLIELIERRLGHLDDAERELLEVVAVGEPVGILVLETARSSNVLDELHRRGLVAIGTDGRRLSTWLAHPLYGEALRARISPLRTRRVKRLLADIVEEAGARRREDVLRLATWRLDSGGSARPELLVTAAQRALEASDPVLAERLARSAADVGGGFAAHRSLASALHEQSRFAEADDVFRRMMEEAVSDDERVSAAEALAMNMWYAQGPLYDSSEGVEAIVERLAAGMADPSSGDRLAALRALIMRISGRHLEAVDTLSGMLAYPETADQTRVFAAWIALPGLAFAGRCYEAIALFDRWHDVALLFADELPLAAERLEYLRVLPLWISGRLHEAQDAAAEGYRAALEAGSHEGHAIWAQARGIVALHQGDLDGARHSLLESARLLRGLDPHGALPWTLSALAQTAAQTGDPTAARTVIAELEARWPDLARSELKRGSITHGIGRARAWSEAAEGALSEARKRMLTVAEETVDLGLLGLAYLTLHDLVRLGDAATAAARLAAIVPFVDGPLAPACLEHAEALAAGDAPELEKAAAVFTALGANLRAAEASSQAAAAYRAAGREASARSAAARARLLARLCPGARTPALTLGDIEELTPREQEVAALAARGHSSREIAERLHVSIRTVDNHLQHVYRKLGVASRGELDLLLKVGATQ
jgi:ATP/maltotriose-dependent transcriptional regulator MalT